MTFEPDTANPHLAKAIELRDIFARDAIERDQTGGKPEEQIRLLKESGLLTILIPREFGGAANPIPPLSRSFASSPRSMDHSATSMGIISVPFRMQLPVVLMSSRRPFCAVRRRATGSGAIQRTVFPRACLAEATVNGPFSMVFGPLPLAHMSQTTCRLRGKMRLQTSAALHTSPLIARELLSQATGTASASDRLAAGACSTTT